MFSNKQEAWNFFYNTYMRNNKQFPGEGELNYKDRAAEHASEMIENMSFLDENAAEAKRKKDAELAEEKRQQDALMAKVKERQDAKARIDNTASTKTLLERAFTELSYDDWDKASIYFEKVLDRESMNTMAYLGLICVDLKVPSEERLSSVKDPFYITNHKYYKRIIDPIIKSRLDSYISIIKARIDEEKKIAIIKAEENQKRIEKAHRKNYIEYCIKNNMVKPTFTCNEIKQMLKPRLASFEGILVEISVGIRNSGDHNGHIIEEVFNFIRDHKNLVLTYEQIEYIKCVCANTVRKLEFKTDTVPQIILDRIERYIREFSTHVEWHSTRWIDKSIVYTDEDINEFNLEYPTEIERKKELKLFIEEEMKTLPVERAKSESRFFDVLNEYRQNEIKKQQIEAFRAKQKEWAMSGKCGYCGNKLSLFKKLCKKGCKKTDVSKFQRW
jgi:hypothetical protein